MTKKGRKPKEGNRGKSGQLSHRVSDDGLVRSQPHRAPFGALLGDSAAGSQLAATAMGRLRLIGEAEERFGIEHVRRKLFPTRAQNNISNGIDPIEYDAALKYAEAVGRERWVRASPKDKPSAIAFMTARGIDLSARDLSDLEAAHYVERFEDCRAVLIAAPCSEDFRRVLRSLRDKVNKLRKGPVRADADDIMRLLRGLGALPNMHASAAIKHAVDLIVIDDRDPDAATLALARRGFKALADFHFGGAAGKAPRARTWGERPTDWSVSAPAPGADGAAERGPGWKGRHRSLGGS